MINRNQESFNDKLLWVIGLRQLAMSSQSTSWDEHLLSVPVSPSPLHTWLFDAETSDDETSFYISFPNWPLTSSTTSTKPCSESEYIIAADSEPDCDLLSPTRCSTPCRIFNREGKTQVEGAADSSGTSHPNSPISDLGPEPSGLETNPGLYVLKLMLAVAIRFVGSNILPTGHIHQQK